MDIDKRMLMVEKVLEAVYWAALFGCFIFIGIKEPVIGIGCLGIVLVFHALNKDHDIEP